MSNVGSYEERYRGFDWKMAEEDLGYGRGGIHNLAYYCSERHCESGLGGKLGLIWEGFTGEVKRFTYDDIRTYSNSFAQFFLEQGLGAGDRICLFMDRIPELYISFLGILKLGGIAQPLFSAFGEEALFTRLEDAGTKAILTTRKHLPKVRRIREQLPQLARIIVVDPDAKAPEKNEVHFAMEKAGRVDRFDMAKVDRETPSVLHYTSGTTGKPKGALHVHSSVIAQYLTTKWVLDLKPDDIYWCNADPGWVTGTSYGIIGPWACGVTQVVLDAGFGAAKWYSFIARHRVTVWYSAPTAIRLLMKEGLDLVRQHDHSARAYYYTTDPRAEQLGIGRKVLQYPPSHSA